MEPEITIANYYSIYNFKLGLRNTCAFLISALSLFYKLHPKGLSKDKKQVKQIDMGKQIHRSKGRKWNFEQCKVLYSCLRWTSIWK